MVNVRVRDGESIEQAIRRFKQECDKENIPSEVRRHEFYKPPSVLRKEKAQETRRRLRQRRFRRY